MARLLQVNRRTQTEPAGYSLKKATQSIGRGVVLDVETVGFSPYQEENVELAITVFRYDRVNGQVFEVVSEYSGLWEPCYRIPRAGTAVHGIARRLVRGSLETATTAVEEDVERGFGPGAGSPGQRSAASLRGELIHGGEVVLLEVGMRIENLCLGHSSTQPSEDVPHRDSQSANAWLTATLARLNRNSCDHC